MLILDSRLDHYASFFPTFRRLGFCSGSRQPTKSMHKIVMVSTNPFFHKFRHSTSSAGLLTGQKYASSGGMKRVLGTALMAILALAFLFGASIPAAHAASLALDGTAEFQGACTVTCSTALTTGTTNDVIIVYFTSVTTPTTNPPVITDAHALSWSLRTDVANTGGILYEYYAVSAATLTADTITATANDGGTSGTIYAFAISGANTATPFDPHSGIPATTIQGAPSPFNLAITTSNANDMIIGAIQGSSTQFAVAAPNTEVDAQCYGTAPISCVEYDIVSSTGSYTVSFTSGGPAASEIIADAVQASGGGGPSVPEFPTGLLVLAVPVLAIYLFMRGKGVSLGTRTRLADAWAQTMLQLASSR